MRSDRILVSGATGFIGGLLARRLLDDGYAVRCLVRDPEDESAEALAALGCEIAVADLTRPGGIADALEGVRYAYFLVHMI
ncbi:MAG: NmrA family NAD(P)-binding protein, partial [Solirubrobacterales bacterium]